MEVRSLKNSGRLPGGLLFVVSAMVAHAADYQTTVTSFNPAAYWRLSETTPVPGVANVITNYGTVGTIGYGSPGTDLTNRAIPGVIGNAMQFLNPTASYNIDYNSLVDVPFNPAFSPNGPFTLEFWANPSTVNDDFVAPVCCMNPNQSRSGWLMYYDASGSPANNQWMWRIGGTSSYAASITSGVGSAPRNAWYHVVGEYDGTNVLLYVNGALKAGPTPATGGAGYNPNNSFPFRIGATTLPNRGFDGMLEQVAFYDVALPSNVVAAHHDASTTNNAGYKAQILSDNPVGYWPLQEPVYTPPDPATLPVTANIGILGTLAAGTNYPGVTTGVAGPPFGGFGANNLASQLDGLGGNIDLGDDPGLNNTFTITMLAWVKPTFAFGVGQNPALQNILSHGYVTDPANAEVELRINAGNYETGSWDGTGEGASDTNQFASLDVAAGNWVFLASAFDGANWNLYRYDSLIATGPGTLGALDDGGNWSIGSRGNPFTLGDARYFGGGVDEVAIFTNALSLAQIQQIFYSANVPPIIVVAPQAPVGTLFEGSSVTLSVMAEGNKPLTYQWTYNAAPISGQVGTTLQLNNLTAAQSGTYAVVVSNPVANVTNSVVLNIIRGAPQIFAQPQSETRYAGATATFSVDARGTEPLSYQWSKGATPIAGATDSTYSRPNIQPADATNYYCVITNPNGSTNSANAALTVLPAPTTPYPVAALGDNPVSYFRLDESSGTVAYDYWGGNNGQYNGVTLGVPGYSLTDPDTAAQFNGAESYVGGIGGINFSGASPSFSIEAWVKGTPAQINNAFIVGKGNGAGGSGGGLAFWQFLIDVTGGFYRFHVDSKTVSSQDATATAGPDGTWQHVAGVYDSVGNQMIIYVNGVLSSTGVPPAGGPTPTPFLTSIGAGQSGNTPAHDVYFLGDIDEVAFYNFALSDSQVLAHYNAQYGANQKPLIVGQPASLTQYATQPAGFFVDAGGSQPLTYQWQKDGSPIAGATDPTLTFAAVAASDAATYTVVVNNALGTSNSTPAVLTVLPVPTTPVNVPGLVMHLPFDGNLTDATGRGNNGVNHGATFITDGKVGPPGNNNALHYLTDTNPPATYAYVSLGVRPDLQFGATKDFSVSYWARLPNNSEEPDLPFFCDAPNSTGGPGFTFAPSVTTVGVGGWAWSLNATRVNGTNNSINDGAWHHLVHTFSRTGNCITYLDNVVVDTTSISAVGNIDSTPPNQACIGQDPTGTYPAPASADLDDLGVWQRVLTPLEVSGIFVAGNNGVSFTGAPPGPPALSFVPSGNTIIITYTGTLQGAATVTGPYSPVLGAQSPYTVPNTGSAQFFRSAQ